jgi:hypothetical protein
VMWLLLGGRPAGVQLWVAVGWRLGILSLLGVGGTGATVRRSPAAHPR